MEATEVKNTRSASPWDFFIFQESLEVAFFVGVALVGLAERCNR